MPEQITFYRDALKSSPFCHRVEIALLECNAEFTVCSVDPFKKPEWFAKVNPMTGKVPVIAYGGPKVAPEDPSPESFRLTESLIILEFLADIFPESTIFPPASDPAARARVRFFVDTVDRSVERPSWELAEGKPGVDEKIIQGLDKIQTLLPDPDAPGSGEYAIGKQFTIADCAIVSVLGFLDINSRTDFGKLDPATRNRLEDALTGEKFERLRRYKKALYERETVKKVVDLDYMEGVWKAMFQGK